MMAKTVREIVVIRDMAAGNAETGTSWQETRILPDTTPLREVMLWAMDESDSSFCYSYDDLACESKVRVTITLPSRPKPEEVTSD